MPKAQYGILRFHKYKGPEIGQIEAHNERTKEKYASNPDIDPARKHLNFNLPNLRSLIFMEPEDSVLCFRHFPSPPRIVWISTACTPPQ